MIYRLWTNWRTEYSGNDRTIPGVMAPLADCDELAIRSRILINNEVLLPNRWRAISFRTHPLTIYVSSSVTSRPVPSSDAIFILWTLSSEAWIRNIAYLTGGREGEFCWMTIFWMSGNFIVEWNYFWLKLNNYFCWMKIIWVEVEQILLLNENNLGWSWKKINASCWI